MKKKKVTELLLMKNQGKKVLHKRMTQALCITMTATMVGSPSMVALANEDIEGGQAVVQPAEETDAKTEDLLEIPAQAEEEQAEEPAVTYATESVETTEANDAANAPSVASETGEVIPTTPMPKLEKGKTYKVPFRMYKAASVHQGDDGNTYGEISMGEFCVDSFDAEIKASEDKTTVKITLKPEAGCIAFNYFLSAEDYETYSTSEEYYLPVIQKLKKGGQPDYPEDGAIYETQEGSGDYAYENAITSFTFELPTTESMVYFSVRAVGMGGGQSEQFGTLGFDYSKMVEVDNTSAAVKELKQTIAEAKEIKNENRTYNESSFGKLTKAIKTAEDKIAAGSMTDEAAAQAKADIEKAKEGLVSLVSIKEAIDEADAAIKAEDKYTAASRDILKAASVTAKTDYYAEDASAKSVASSEAYLRETMKELVPVAEVKLDKDKLKDGVYSLGVNLWDEKNNKESMGNDALYHTAELTVKDGKYTLKLKGHEMMSGKLKGEIDAFRVIPDGEKPNKEDTNYKELEIKKDGKNYYVEFELENGKSASEYYYGGIKVHAVAPNGDIVYPMGQGWTGNRIRLSWDNLTLEKAFADFTEINKTIKDAKAIKNEDNKYSKDSFEALKSAIKAAEDLVGKDGVTQDEVDQAKTKITEAKEKLVDISALKTAIEDAEKTLAKTDEYTGASLSIFKKVVEDAKGTYAAKNPTQRSVDKKIENLTEGAKALVAVSKEKLDVNNLKDGVYEVPVNLWNEASDDESMGNAALYHTATLTVKDGKYQLRVKGHEMKVMILTGGLDALRIVPDGAKPLEDESNYVEYTPEKEGTDYIIDLELTNTDAVTEYYYSGIKIHAIDGNGNISYPMGQNWIGSRLRVSWEGLSLKKVFVDFSELNKTLEDAKAIKNDDNKYSAGSFEALQNAIKDAEAISGSEDATDESVKEAKTKVEDAKKKLVDISGLKTAIENGDALLAKTDEYTGASLSIYKAVVDGARGTYESKNPTQKAVDGKIKAIEDGVAELVAVAKEAIDPNNLKDGEYQVAVNLWDAAKDKESMGNDALYHTAILRVKDGKYMLEVKGHEMTVMNMTGGLDKLRIVPNGEAPVEDESNFVEYVPEKDGKDYIINVELTNTDNVTEYYHSGIQIHAVNKQGDIIYPMGQNWIGSRLRVSWESLTLNKLYVDTTALETAVKDAKAIKNEDGKYTVGSFKKLQNTIKDAEKLLKSEDVKEEAVNEAQKAIEDAKNALVDLSGLKAVIDDAESKMKQKDVYTDASLAKLKDALNIAKTSYYNENAKKSDVQDAKEYLEAAMVGLVKKSEEKLDKNQLEDGVYTVAVNLWHATDNKESMGNDALYHTADLTVDGGKYTLRIRGHKMTTSGQTGELDAIRIVPDGKEPKGDGSNYKELSIQKDGEDYFIDVELDNPKDVSDYYYAGIKVHTVNAEGEIGYPMGKNWINNRLRISWDTLSTKESADKYPAFSAVDEETGITVSAPEGALPKGTKLRITKLTEGEKADAVNQALSNLTAENTAYDVSLYIETEKGEETVEPLNGMELTVTLPIPSGYDKSKLVCYYVDENSYANKMEGAVADTTVAVRNSKIGVYAIGQKIGRVDGTPTPSKPGTSNLKPGTPTASTNLTTKPGTPSVGGAKAARTGDSSRLATTLLSFGAAIAAMAGVVVFRKKKEDPEDVQ